MKIAAALRAGSVVREFYGAPLGNRLRNRRLERIVSGICREPGDSFPSLLSSDAALEGFYRFLGGKGYSAADIMEPHAQQTSERVVAAGARAVVVAHDTTEFEFPGEAEREGLGRLRGKAKGFLAHVSLAVDRESRRPLGVLASRTWSRMGPARTKRPDGKRKSGSDYAQELNKESERWIEAVEEAEARTPGVIHVMDREADAYPLLVKMAQGGIRFVVRLARDRAVGAEVVSGIRDRMSDVLPEAEVLAEREVPLSRRRAETAPKSRRFPAREGRTARLSVRAMSLMLQRPNHVGAQLPKWLPINVVHVVEVCPPDATNPIEWTLLTTEPIATAAEVLAVVDSYRSRWVIEEYFKALKQGCAVEKRQLESYEALCKALAILMPIAWKLLELRSLGRADGAKPAREVLSVVQLEVLRACGSVKLGKNATCREAMLAVAGLGGHIKNNGDPGWQVLGRGLERLLLLELGWSAATATRTKKT